MVEKFLKQLREKEMKDYKILSWKIHKYFISNAEASRIFAKNYTNFCGNWQNFLTYCFFIPSNPSEKQED